MFRFICCLLSVSLVLGFAPVGAQDSSGVRKVGEIYSSWDCAYDMALSGHYAYIADGRSGLRIVNITDPTNPREVGFYDTWGTACGIAVSGNYAYVADGVYGLRVVDITDPKHPFEVGSWQLREHKIRAIVVSGDYAYVTVGSGLGFRVLDISDPPNPHEVGYCRTQGWDGPNIALSGNYAYVSTGLHLQIIDITIPTNPVASGSIETRDWCGRVTVSGKFAYLTIIGSGLSVIDISNPDEPVESGFCEVKEFPNDVTIEDNYAYTASSGGLSVVDISNPAEPLEISRYRIPHGGQRVIVSGKYAYVCGYGGLNILDIVNPKNLRNVGHYNALGEFGGVAVSQNYAYVTDIGTGLRVVNVVNPTEPFEVSSCKTRSTSDEVGILENYAYVVGTYSICIVDIKDSEHVQVVNQIDLPCTPKGISLNDHYAYLLSQYGGMYVFDISNPLAPEEVGWCELPEDFLGVVVFENYAYIAAAVGLYVVEVSNPEKPQIIGFCKTQETLNGVAVSGNYAYVVSDKIGLRVLDISNPTEPKEVGSYDTPGHARCVVVSKNLAYVADGFMGLRVIDISNPTKPIEKGFYHTREIAEGVAIGSNGLIYVADISNLSIFDVSDLTPLTCSVTSPNGNEAFSIGETIDITWKAQGGAGINTSIISYQSGDNAPWVEIGTTEGENFTIPWQIPYQTGQYKIMVEVFDNDGESVSDKSEPFSVGPMTLKQRVGAGWSLVSVPLIQPDMHKKSVLGDDLEGIWGLIGFDGGIRQIFPDSLENAKGYLLGVVRGAELDVTGVPNTNLTHTFTLKKGWNTFGSPFHLPTPLADATVNVMLEDGEAVLTFDQAVDGGIISPVAYNFFDDRLPDNQDWPFVNGFQPYDTLQNWRGYWYLSYKDDVQLIIPNPEAPNPRDDEVASLDDWQLDFVCASDLSADNVQIGVNQAATSGFDNRFDYVEPPKPEIDNRIRMYFDHANWDIPNATQFSRDIRAPLVESDVGEWTLTIESTVATDLTLFWSAVADTVLDKYSFTLVDPDNDTKLDLQTVKEYKFRSDGTKQLIVLVVPIEESVNSADATVKGFGLGACYPNPFNSVTTIVFGIETTGWTRMDVVDINGRLWTRQMDGVQPAGSHTITWNAKAVPTGIYFVRLTDSSGRVAVKKVTLLK